MSSHLLGVSLALLSALLFGGGDFSGGFATRRGFATGRGTATGRHRPFQVLAWSALSGALGLVALYRALAQGNAAVVSPIAGVVGAALPVVVGVFTEGFPGAARLLGFASAMIGIGLVTRAPSHSAGAAREPILLAGLSGLAFGAFFLFAAQIEPGPVLTPLLVAKVTGGCVAWGAAVLTQRRRPALRGSGVAWLAGALDAAANALYLLAQQYTRLDVAVVLTSLYPAVTVLLAYLLLRERTSRAQWAGVALCTTAIALIAAR